MTRLRGYNVLLAVFSNFYLGFRYGHTLRNKGKHYEGKGPITWHFDKDPRFIHKSVFKNLLINDIQEGFVISRYKIYRRCLFGDSGFSAYAKKKFEIRLSTGHRKSIIRTSASLSFIFQGASFRENILNSP